MPRAKAETPPLARGRRNTREIHAYNLGNTPACAGKTIHVACRDDSAEKHPRLRGEDTVKRKIVRRHKETPPLARGRRCRVDEAVKRLRNTPACAGKTLIAVMDRLSCGKHPRLRGEDLQFSFAVTHLRETPPLARGRRILQILVSKPLRNTPACAGKTRRIWFAWECTEKHPRLRGEDGLLSNKPAGILGNTPACAGKTISINDLREAFQRNTPACAGKTCLRLLIVPLL